MPIIDDANIQRFAEVRYWKPLAMLFLPGNGNMNDPEQIKQQLTVKTKHLLFPSESDVPIEVVDYSPPGSITDHLVSLRADKGNTAVAEVAYEDFYNMYALPKEWHNDIQKGFANNFRESMDMMKGPMPELRIFRVGQVNIDLYVLARVPNTQRWVGLKTGVVETGG